MDSEETPKSFLGAFASKPNKMKEIVGAKTTCKESDSLVDETGKPNDSTEVESDSESSHGVAPVQNRQQELKKPKNDDHAREQDETFEPVLDNPPQKRTSFLAMFFNNSDSDIEVDPQDLTGPVCAEVETVTNIAEDPLPVDDDPSLKNDSRNNNNAEGQCEHVAPPTKAPGFWGGLFNQKSKETVDQAELVAEKPSTAVPIESNFNEENASMDLGAQPKKKNDKGFFEKVFNSKPDLSADKDLDLSENKANKETKEGEAEDLPAMALEEEATTADVVNCIKIAETGMDGTEDSNPDGERITPKKDTAIGFFGKLFQRNQKHQQNQELSKEPSEEIAPNDTELDANSKRSEEDNEIGSTISELAKKYNESNPSSASESTNAAASEDIVIPQENSPSFFGLFGKSKGPKDEVVLSSAKDVPDDSKSEGGHFGSKGKETDSDTHNEHDKAVYSVPDAEEDRRDFLDEFVTDADGNEVEQVLEGDVLLEETTEESEVKSCTQQQQQQQDHQQATISEEQTGDENKKAEILAVGSSPSDDPYWDENLKDSKEKMCCSFLFR